MEGEGHSFCHSEERMKGEVDQEKEYGQCKWSKTKVRRSEKQEENASDKYPGPFLGF